MPKMMANGAVTNSHPEIANDQQICAIVESTVEAMQETTHVHACCFTCERYGSTHGGRLRAWVAFVVPGKMNGDCPGPAPTP